MSVINHKCKLLIYGRNYRLILIFVFNKNIHSLEEIDIKHMYF